MGPAVVLPLLLAGAGMVAQNVQNKATQKNAQNAQTGAQQQSAYQTALAQQNLANWMKANPAPSANWGNIQMPSSMGGGIMGLGGQYISPPPSATAPSGFGAPSNISTLGQPAITPTGATNLQNALRNPTPPRRMYLL